MNQTHLIRFFTLVVASLSFAVSATELVIADKLQWTPLNPLRGDKSPQAATLWGDPERKQSVATGFLVKFADGFSSPPHIHNVTYRGVVISGLVHNDDPTAAKMWMPQGSFWTQPAGESHITAAKGSGNIAYIEIDQGPYLVKPVEEAFDKGERPVNVDVSNLVWVEFEPSTANVEIAYLWGSPSDSQVNGTMLRLPAGFNGSIQTDNELRSVVISGQITHRGKALSPGSYFGSATPTTYKLSAEQQSVVYLRSKGRYRIANQ
ncbi:DUF4437 domain-containing protein [Paraferrimonas sedimenticola]|uniref:DUF4437 domain-containing protein n=1 Tax=Paraferrimonas sedimenticola TaxID=375674 RepID=A0AA37RUL6_9GAMM|nr:DUF4437 domain-containing protein [Paraferrimonas sedimenticola]GLP95144.1 hypothetical protein GCM10007895_04500 [Paraferrimonas sedimenticola]